MYACVCCSQSILGGGAPGGGCQLSIGWWVFAYLVDCDWRLLTGERMGLRVLFSTVHVERVERVEACS